jgi:hypothetical protein
MDSEAVQWYMIKPIAATQYTIAAQDGMLEVYLTSEEIYVKRAVVQDVAFFYQWKKWSRECSILLGRQTPSSSVFF